MTGYKLPGATSQQLPGGRIGENADHSPRNRTLARRYGGRPLHKPCLLFSVGYLILLKTKGGHVDRGQLDHCPGHGTIEVPVGSTACFGRQISGNCQECGCSGGWKIPHQQYEIVDIRGIHFGRRLDPDDVP